MAASPRAEIAALPHAQEKWTPAENGGPPADLDKREPAGHTSGDLSASADLNDRYRSDPPPAGQDQTTPREKQIKVPTRIVIRALASQCSLLWLEIVLSLLWALRFGSLHIWRNACLNGYSSSRTVAKQGLYR